MQLQGEAKSKALPTAFVTFNDTFTTTVAATSMMHHDLRHWSTRAAPAPRVCHPHLCVASDFLKAAHSVAFSPLLRTSISSLSKRKLSCCCSSNAYTTAEVLYATLSELGFLPK